MSCSRLGNALSISAVHTILTQDGNATQREENQGVDETFLTIDHAYLHYPLC